MYMMKCGLLFSELHLEMFIRFIRNFLLLITPYMIGGLSIGYLFYSGQSLSLYAS